MQLLRCATVLLLTALLGLGQLEWALAQDDVKLEGLCDDPHDVTAQRGRTHQILCPKFAGLEPVLRSDLPAELRELDNAQLRAKLADLLECELSDFTWDYQESLKLTLARHIALLLGDRRSAHEALCRWLLRQNYSWSNDTWQEAVEGCMEEARELGDDRSFALAHQALGHFYDGMAMDDSAHLQYAISRSYFLRAGDKERVANIDEYSRRRSFADGRFDLYEEVTQELLAQAEQESDLALRYEKYQVTSDWLAESGDFFGQQQLEQEQQQLAKLLDDEDKQLLSVRAASVYAFSIGNYQRSAVLLEQTFPPVDRANYYTEMHWLRHRGLTQLFAGNVDQAIEHFNRFMSKANSQRGWPYTEQAEIIRTLIAANELDVAGKFMRKLSRYDVPFDEWQSLDSIHGNLQFPAMEYLLASGDYEKVIRYVEPKNENNLFWVWDTTREYLLGKAHLGLGQHDAAIDLLTQHVDELVRDGEAILNVRHVTLLGDAYLARGDDEQALEHYLRAFAIGCEGIRMLLHHRYLVESPLIAIEESAAKARALLLVQGRVADVAALDAQLQAAVDYREWLAADMPDVSAETHQRLEELSRLRSASFALSWSNANPRDYIDMWVREHRRSSALGEAGRREQRAIRTRVAERIRMYEADAQRLLERIALDDPRVAELVNLGPLDRELFAPYDLYAWTNDLLDSATTPQP